jgi:hypothetical protein
MLSPFASHSEIVKFGQDDLSLEVLLHVAADLLENLIDEPLLAVQSDNPDSRPLPFILIVELREGGVEAAVDPIPECVQHFSFVLKGSRVWQENLKGEKADDHARTCRLNRFGFLYDIGDDDIALLDIFKLVETDPALQALRHLRDIFLDPLE